MSEMLHIVAGIQLDETSDMVLARLSEITGGLSDCRIHFCHGCGEATSDVEAATRRLAQGERRLQAWATSRLIGNPMAAKAQLHVALGDPADLLMQLAADVEAHFIVVGTHHKNRWKQLTKGSPMRKTVDEAPCSVIVATPRSFAGYEKSPQIEAPRKDTSAPHYAHPQGYHYRRSIPFADYQSTVGAGGEPLHPSH